MLLLVTLIALCVCTLGGAVRDNVLLGDDPLPKNMLSTTNPQYRTDGSKREQVSLITCDFPLSLLSTSALPIPPDRYPKMHLNHPNAICIQVRPPIQKSAKTKGTYLWIRHKDASMSPGDLRYCLWIFTVKPYGDKLGSSSKFFEPCGAEYNLHVRGHAISDANNVGNQIDRVGVYSIQDDSAALYHHLKRTGMGHFHIIRVADFRIAKSHSGADVTAEHARTLEMDLFGTLRGSGSAVMDGTGDEGVTTGGDVPVQDSGEPGGTGARSTGTADRTSSAQDRGAAPETAPNKSSKHNPFSKMLSAVKNAQNLAAIQLTWSLGQEQKDFNYTLPEFKCNESNTTFHITTGRKKTSMQTHVSLQDVRDLEAFTLLHLFGTIVVPRSSPATDATSAPNNTVPGDETQQGANTNSDKNMSDEDLSVQKDNPKMLRIDLNFYDVDVQTFKRHKPGSSSPQPWNHTSMLFQVRCTESGNPIGLRCVESAARTVCHFHLFMELPENSSSMVITLYTYGVPFELHDFSVATIVETRGDRNIFRDISARRGIERRYAAHMRRCSAMKRKAFSVLHALRTVGDQDSSARGAPRQSTARQRLEDLVQRHSVLIKHPDNAAPSAPDTKETDVSSIIDQLSRATLSTAALIQSLQGNLRERVVGLWHKGTDLTVHHAVGSRAASNLRLCSSALTKELASMQRSCSTLLEPLREATENLLKLFVAGRERFGFVGRYGSPSIPASGRVVEAPDAVHSELVDLAERHARIARRAADLTAHVASLEQLVAAGRGGASQGRGLAIRRTLSGVLSAVGTAALCVVVIIALFGRRLRRMRRPTSEM